MPTKSLCSQTVGNGQKTMATMPPKPHFTFQHPFTMLTAAPTGGGKTWFVKKLLENRTRWIQPTPQRIIWLYGQWQPLYDDMQRTIPGIEFVKGIPWNIDEDSFLDPKVRNLIVIDDLMSEATKDSKICDLFTKGSHHRNLSVICLLQNLYYQGKENRTMSLNSHYLVLFKNPRDQQQVMTLARQMYPGNSQRFMDIYKEATDIPYGNLVVDLKPGTSDSERFQPNILESIDSEAKRGISECNKTSIEEMANTKDGDQINLTHIFEELRQMRQSLDKNTRPYDEDDILEPPGKRFKRTPSTESHHSELDPSSINMPSCSNCGAYYATWEDLLQHQSKNCPVSTTKNGKTKQNISLAEERHLWLHPGKAACEELREEYNNRIQELMENEGKSERAAEKKAYNEMVPRLRKRSRRALADYLIHVLQLQKTDVYQKLMEMVDNLINEEEFSLEEAVKQALKQRKFMFERLLPEMKRGDSVDDTEKETDTEERRRD